MIKEALLDKEKEQIKEFLLKYNLHMDEVEKTYYSVNDNDEINGTISYLGNIIKCLAVDLSSRDETLASTLVSKVISEFNSLGIYSYKVYTKPEYEIVFSSLGFKTLTKDPYFVYLEAGSQGIMDEIKGIKTRIECTLGPINEDSDIGCTVINANPMTIGHEYLIEQIAKKHDKVIVFVVEEDKSLYSFNERLSMVYLAMKRLDNVVVVPSGSYIVSSLTFPSYFLKEDDVEREKILVDGLIFRDYFMKELFIKKRYVGSEIKNKMISYNETLKEVLGDHLVVIDRLKVNDEIVSASRVRDLVLSNKIDEALKFIPTTNQALFKLISSRLNE